VFRIIKFLLFIALLGGAYGLYHLNADKQREQEVLAWSNRLIWDALSTDAAPRFGGQSVADGPADKSWRVNGRLAARTAAGTPIEGDYQALIVQRCSTADDERCWELQAFRVGEEVIVAGAGLLDAPQPAAAPEPALPQATAPAASPTAPAAQAGSAAKAGSAATAGPEPGKAEKAVIFALPPPSVAEPSLGFSPVAPAGDAQPVGSASEAAVQLAMRSTPKAAPTPPAQAAAPPKQDEADAVPEQQIETVPVAPVELAGRLEAATTPAAGQPADAEPADAEPAEPAVAPAPAATEQTAALAAPEAATADAERFDPTLLRETQDRLLRLDYGKGRLTRSGAFDAATQAAILAYQAKNGLPASGRPSSALLAHMDGFLARLDAIAGGRAAPQPAAAGQAASPLVAPRPVADIGGYSSFRKGLAAAERGQIEEAIAHYTRAIESTEWRERHMAYLSRGKALAGQGNYRQAVNDYSTAIDLRPDYADAWINRGLAFAELAQREQALADLRQGQRLAPDSNAAAQALRIIESRSQLE